MVAMISCAIMAPIAIRLALMVERPAAIAPAITNASTQAGLYTLFRIRVILS